jgi:hypothetical protein
MVVAMVALFVALGGIGYAAVSGSSLVDRSVPGKKLKRHAVGHEELAGDAVNGGNVARDALTGADVRESRLGTVPSASSVGGLRAARIDFRAKAGAGERTVFDAAGLVLRAACDSNLLASDLRVTALTRVDHAEIQSAYNVPDSNARQPPEGDRLAFDDDFGPNDRFDPLPGADDQGEGTLSYATPAGAQVTVIFQSDDVSVLGRSFACLYSGTALYAPARR